MKYLQVILIFALLTAGQSLCGAKAKAPFDDQYAFELLRYLYRWHMDDAVLSVDPREIEKVEIHYRTIDKALDEGDHSEFLEIIIPVADMLVMLKRADYRIPKLDIQIDNEYFKVVSAHHYRDLKWNPEKYQRLSYDSKRIFDYLYKTRNDKHFPPESTRQRLKEESIRALRAEGYIENFDDPVQQGYIAPISIVSNDLWFYWINGHKLIHFTSDLEHLDSEFWTFAPLGVDIIDLNEEVVVAPAERGNPGAFTKDYAGRILFNCIVHGQKVSDKADTK
ncbi:MAG: hypothetical protein AAGH40_12715 [Verrucomicrobiota bacterium]